MMKAKAASLLAETRLEINGSKISVHTPEEDHHSLGTVLLVKAPKDANLNLSVHNGGVSLNGFTGTAEAHAQNGGISFQAQQRETDRASSRTAASPSRIAVAK